MNTTRMQLDGRPHDSEDLSYLYLSYNFVQSLHDFEGGGLEPLGTNLSLVDDHSFAGHVLHTTMPSHNAYIS